MRMFTTELQRETNDLLKAQGYDLQFTLEDNAVTWAFYVKDGRRFVAMILAEGNFTLSEVIAVDNPIPNREHSKRVKIHEDRPR